MRKIIARKKEKEILKESLKSNRSELIAVYGKRRVGKTFLINGVYKKYIKFEFTGTRKIPLKDQLNKFYLTLSYKISINKPTSWIEG